MTETMEQKARRFAALTARKRRLKAELSRVEADIKAIEAVAIEAMVDASVSSMKMGGATLYVYSKTRSALVVPDGMTRVEARLAACRVLEAMGHSSMITYNHQSVTALLKELEGDDGEVPPPLGTYVRAEKEFRLGMRGAPSFAEAGADSEDEEAEDGEG